MKKIIFGLFVFVLVFSLGLMVKAETATTLNKKAEVLGSEKVSINRVLNVGSRGEDVKELQKILKEKGFLKAIATGYFGAQTKEAVRKYQKDANFINANGKVDIKTIEMIKNEELADLNSQTIKNVSVSPSPVISVPTATAPTADEKTITVNPNDIAPSGDTTPRIMFWWGKVNQHIDSATGKWLTDPDGTSGANLDKLAYCKKWFPKTTKIEDYKIETIGTWQDKGNTQDRNRIKEYYTPKMSTKCVEDSTIGRVQITTENTEQDAVDLNFDRKLKVGLRGEDVKELQKILKEKGFLSTNATGYYGTLTKEAVKKYQKQNNLSSATGEFDTATLEKIKEEVKKSSN